MAMEGMQSEVCASVWPDASSWGLLGLEGSCVLSYHPVSPMNLISAFNSLSLVCKHGISMSLPPILYHKFSLAL